MKSLMSCNMQKNCEMNQDELRLHCKRYGLFLVWLIRFLNHQIKFFENSRVVFALQLYDTLLSCFPIQCEKRYNRKNVGESDSAVCNTVTWFSVKVEDDCDPSLAFV